MEVFYTPRVSGKKKNGTYANGCPSQSSRTWERLDSASFWPADVNLIACVLAG